MTRARLARGVLAIAAIAAITAACGKKSKPSGPPPEVTGLAAVPSNAEVVIGADVAKLADAPLVERAIDQLLLSDPKLAVAWKDVRDGCKLSLTKQVHHLILALGPVKPGGRVGTGPAILIAIGALPETELSACVGKLVGKGGGSITGRAAAGRTLYQVKDGARTMYFAYGRPDTVVLGTDDAYVLEAVGAGKKALDDPELAAWLKRVDQNRPVWAVGRVDPRVRQGLVGVLPGLKAGPSAFLGSLDPRDGVSVELGVIMASPDDAKQLESITNDQRKLIAAAAQARSLGKLVHRVAISHEKDTVWLRAALSQQDVNDVLSALDGKAPAAQDSPPPAR